MSWLINARSQLSLDSKLTVHKAILRPIWTYGIELWGCSKPSNTKILQIFHSKMLRMISSAHWYVSKQTLHGDFEIQYVKEVVRINANKYKNRSTQHGNQLIRAHFNPLADRLIRLWPEDSPIAQLQWTADAWCLPHDLFSPHSYWLLWVDCNFQYTLKIKSCCVGLTVGWTRRVGNLKYFVVQRVT